jgi:hypothetical protein
VLADPAGALKPQTGQIWQMPDLGLKGDEIAALTEYLSDVAR